MVEKCGEAEVIDLRALERGDGIDAASTLWSVFV